MLNVQCRDDGDAGRERIIDILIAFLVLRAGRVRMSQFIHERDLRMSLHNRLDIHLFECHVSMWT